MSSGRVLAMLAIMHVAAGCDFLFQLDPVSPPGEADAALDDASTTTCFGETFDANAVDESVWEVSDAAPTATVGQSGGQLVFDMGIAAGNNYGQIRTAVRDLTNDSVAVEIVQAPNGLTQAEAGFSLRSDSTHRYEMFVTANKLDMRWTDGGANDDMKIPFDDTTRFWRMKNDGASMVYETSGDGVEWTSRRIVAVMVPVNALRISLFAGTYQAEATDPGTAAFDNLRVDCAD